MKSKKITLSYYAIGSMMALSVNLLTVKSLGFNMPLFKLFILSIGIWSGLYFSSLLPKKILFILVTLSSIYISFICLDTYESIENFLNWSYDYILGLSIEVPHEFDKWLLIVFFLISSMTVATLLRSQSKKWLLSFLGTFFIIQWFRYVNQAIMYFNLFILSLSLLFITEYYVKSYEKAEEDNKRLEHFSYGKTMIYGIIVSLMIIGLTNLISIEFKPIPLEKLNHMVREVFPNLTQWRSSQQEQDSKERFSFKNTPFQPNSKKLGGPIKEKYDNIVMLVKADESHYLRGRIKDHYTGEKWSSTNNQYEEIKAIDFIDTKEISPNTKSRIRVEIIPVELNTSTLFAPYKPVRIEGNHLSKIYYNRDLELYASNKLFNSKPQKYTVVSEISMLKDPYYQQNEKALEEVHNYLQLPKDLPKRIEQLSREITKDYEDDYFKMKAIESYLRQNFPYELEVEELPNDKDFVDYFLFEQQRGYCTYFASAMAIMGRSLGIPTRYVEGFVMPEKPNEQGFYEIRAKQAHAWVEGYFKDKGWMAFEPTSAYPIRIETQDEQHVSGSDRNLTDAAIAQIKKTNRDYLEYKQLLEEDNFMKNYSNGFERKESNTSLYKKTALLIFVVMLMVVFMLRTIYCITKNHKIFKENLQEELDKRYALSILSLIAHLKSNMDGQTPREYLELAHSWGLEKVIQNKSMEMIDRALYDKKSIDIEDLILLKKLKKDIESYVKERKGVFYFFYHKFIRGDLYNKKTKYNKEND